jgi:hypothetical protein
VRKKVFEGLAMLCGYIAIRYEGWVMEKLVTMCGAEIVAPSPMLL